jgi:hypothetical protein
MICSLEIWILVWGSNEDTSRKKIISFFGPSFVIVPLECLGIRIAKQDELLSLLSSRLGNKNIHKTDQHGLLRTMLHSRDPTRSEVRTPCNKLFGTHPIHKSQRINYFLEQTYLNSSKMDCQPSLHLITSLERLNPTTQPHATTPPILHPSTSPFLVKSLTEIAEILRSMVADESNTIDPDLFAVLDGKSVLEDSGLIVQVKDGGAVESVRVHFDTVNAELIRVRMITFDIAETKGLVGADGVFRTQPPQESRKGGCAVRKKLG